MLADAHNLLAGAAYDDDTLKVIRQALRGMDGDHHERGSNPIREDSEIRLAHAVLSYAKTHGRDAGKLRDAALAAILPTLTIQTERAFQKKCPTKGWAWLSLVNQPSIGRRRPTSFACGAGRASGSKTTGRPSD